MTAWFFRIGQFSLINDALCAGLAKEFPQLEWREVDVERDIVAADPILHARALAETGVRYGKRILRARQPPRDFFPRLPVVIDAVRAWVRKNVDPRTTQFVFQTQSIFDARHPDCSHFLYTDHTYLANRRYPTPRPTLPVPAGWLKMERELYARADCTFVSSAFAGRSVIEDYAVAPARVECVFSGCNVLPAEPQARGGNVILFVGVDWERKGGPELMAAFRQVRNVHPSAELWIVGCNPDVRDEGVHISGRLPADRLGELYAKADVFCLPSRMDPSASVLAEAAINGLPVVATPVGGNSERVIEGETGFLCSAEALADRLGRLLADASTRQRMGEAGRRLVLERFTWEAVCARIADRIRRTV